MGIHAADSTAPGAVKRSTHVVMCQVEVRCHAVHDLRVADSSSEIDVKQVHGWPVARAQDRFTKSRRSRIVLKDVYMLDPEFVRGICIVRPAQVCCV